MTDHDLFHSRGWTFRISSEVAEPSFAAICSLPSSEHPEGVFPVTSSEGTEVRRFRFRGKDYFLKEYLFQGWKKHLKVLRRGEHLAKIARQMESRGFHSPRVVGIGRCGKRRRVVTEAVEEARDIVQVLFPQQRTHRGPVDDGFVQQFGATIGEMHACGFFHGDLRWRNVLVRQEGDGWKFYLIDNDRTRRYRRLPMRCRIKNLTQILFSGMLLDWPRSEWETFLQAYFDRTELPGEVRQDLVAAVESKAGRRLSERRERK